MKVHFVQTATLTAHGPRAASSFSGIEDVRQRAATATRID